MAEEDRAETPRPQLRDSLRRIEALVSALERIADPAAREPARELFELLLEVHGLALARTTARIARSPDGEALLEALGRDDQVAPVLLLYGLHPDDADTRVRAALAALQPELRTRASRATLASLARNAATVRVERAGTGAADSAEIRELIEAAVLEAAPELEGVEVFVIEGRPHPRASVEPADAVAAC